jgi:hypothetical protein
MNPINNHNPQLEMWKCPTRFMVAVAGRRLGKTFLAREKLCKASETRKGLYWYVAPTRLHAKELLWEDLKERFDQLGWKYKKDETALSITRKKTGCQIVLKSAERPERLRGKGLNGVIFDECADIKRETWTKSVRPSLSDKLGWAWFLGTPKGYNWYHDLYQAAKVEGNWTSYSFKTVDSPFFQTPEGLQEIEDAKKDLDLRTYRQEYEASFETYSGRICYAFDRNKNHTDYTFNSDNGAVICGIDFNVLPMSAVLKQRVGNKLIQFGEVSLQTSSTDELCKVIKSKGFGVPLIARPDATGANRHSSSSKSDHVILKEHGFILEVKKTNPPRVDRWAAQNRAYERQLTMINTKECPKTTKDLETVCYKEGTCEPDLKGILHGHLFDADGYSIYIDYPIRSPKRISQGRPL